MRDYSLFFQHLYHGRIHRIFAITTALHYTIKQRSEDKSSEDYSKGDLFGQAEETYVSYKLALLEGLAALQPIPLSPPPPQPAANQPQPPPPINQQSPNDPNENVNVNFNAYPHDFRLPTISFAQKPKLSNLHRLHYLKGSLAGDAKRLVTIIKTSCQYPSEIFNYSSVTIKGNRVSSSSVDRYSHR